MILVEAVVFAVVTLISIVASGHVIQYKRDPRAAVSWVGLVWLAPVIGAVLYLLLGINRVRRRAHRLQKPSIAYQAPLESVRPDDVAAELPSRLRGLGELARVADRVADHPLVAGNEVGMLVNGEQAYPEMLDAIDSARYSVTLSSYIFASDHLGRRFEAALAAAVDRGVAVRVIIDRAGERYSWPSMVRRLRRAGVPVARFDPGPLLTRILALNLRTHRKLLVVDGWLAFTGGMNIRRHHLAESGARRATRDVHFRVAGPVVRQLQDVFVEDWLFCTGERLEGGIWFPELEHRGPTVMRGVFSGPDETLGKLPWILHAAIGAARESIRIVTPYFLPDRSAIMALNLAAMRGVRVEILLPARNNLRLVQWAMMAQLWQVLEYGCRVWLTPPPFDHSKLLLVDGAWTFMGSMNWDPRSLRLNFELNCECYDAEMGGIVGELIASKRARARELTLAEVDARALPVRLRDGVARLLTPYL